MTFYWWSHWFWITSLSNILLFITIVHTYPSQEISLEFNQNSRTMKTGVTKLFQTTTTTLAWSTAAPAGGNNAFGSTVEKTVLQSVTPDMAMRRNDELPTDELDEYPLDDAEDLEDQGEADEEQPESEVPLADNDASEEFKRSAERYNKTSGEAAGSVEPSIVEGKEEPEKDASKAEVAAVAEVEPVKFKREESEMNNYTNFSSVAGVMSINTTSSRTIPAAAAAAQSNQSVGSATDVVAASAPAAPKITGAQAALDWFNALAAMTSTSTAASSSSGIAAAEIAMPQSQRVPFTLENANKEDELRRAESEHRSRKSKVLSAEYMHINRFINLSSDSKNLLTRSASTAPEYDAEESNISSEALAIQRTYFLDAGVISAICFTIFGVCCAVGTVGIVLYRRRFLNKPQALSEPDSSVYIDDSTMRDNSDEMYSLDNDSFLNSLEAMTIQNYWTDTVKHTKL